jgi:hypothetical protein
MADISKYDQKEFLEWFSPMLIKTFVDSIPSEKIMLRFYNGIKANDEASLSICAHIATNTAVDLLDAIISKPQESLDEAIKIHKLAKPFFEEMNKAAMKEMAMKEKENETEQ